MESKIAYPTLLVGIAILISTMLIPSNVHASSGTPSYMWTQVQSGTTVRLYDIDGAVYSGNWRDLWAVGERGTILHHDGNTGTWHQHASGTTEDLYSVYYQNQAAVWAVGANGTILFYDSSYDTWIPQTGAPAGALLTSVSGSGGAYGNNYESIWAVGSRAGPLILRFNPPPYEHVRNGTWVQETSPVSMVIDDVVAVGYHDAWAVGTGGGIIHYAPIHDNTWVTAKSPNASENLITICGQAYYGGYSLWAGGDSGTPLYYYNGSWEPETNSFGTILGSDQDSYDIAAWAVGASGVLYSYKNTDSTWQSLFRPGVTLRGVCHLTDRSVWVVGDNGTIYYGTQYLGNNYIELTVSPETTFPGGDFRLYYHTHTAEWRYQGVPCDVYLAYIVNPETYNKAATISETLNSGELNIFSHGMSSSYRYAGRLRAPTFSNVRIPPAASSGSLPFSMSSSSVSATMAFAVVFIRRDNGQYVRADYPAEISNLLTID